MAGIGKFNKFKVARVVDFGAYLDGEELGDILLPVRYVPNDCKVDDWVEVFVYFDSEDRIIATTDKPYASVGEFAMLKVIAVNKVGAFLDWGLMKDLLVPFSEQKMKMEVGRSYLAYVYLDHITNRITASAKIDKFLDNIPAEFEEGQEVDLIIENQTEIGYKAIINNSHWGILYKNEVFQSLAKGQHCKGYIKKIREDERIDLILEKPGYQKIDPISQEILRILKENNGFIELSDKSDAELIYNMFGISKKTYKKAIGSLYRRRLIKIENDGIHMIDDQN
jgi:predicted RNA-binding protein (virulence factor B family)